MAQLPPADGPNTVTGTALEPRAQTPTPELMARLRLPDGFKISMWATGLKNARMLLVNPDGSVYLSRRQQGDVLLLRDANGDGRAESVRAVASNMPLVNGLARQGDKLFMVTDKILYAADIQGDGSLSRPRVVTNDLPDAGQHPNRTIAFGPDGLLYLTLGSTCNNCDDANPEAATIVRFSSNFQSREVYAEGLRNTIGFGWHPVSRALYGFDHGSDWRGDDQPPEELNKIERGKDYGWPWCYANRQPDRFQFQDPPNASKAAFCPTTAAPVLTYTAHSAPLQMSFYTGSQFPSAYKNDAFITMRGSWNRSEPSGYKVVRVRFDERGNPVGMEDFVTGFVFQENGLWKQFGRLAGLAQMADGSLLFTDDQGGVIYRVTYGQ